MRILLLALLATVVFTAASAHADCCRVAKVDSTTPSSTVQVCEPGADGGCGALLFGGTLELGEASPELCPDGRTLVYQEYDPTLEAFGAPVEAVCEGADVEI